MNLNQAEPGQPVDGGLNLHPGAARPEVPLVSIPIKSGFSLSLGRPGQPQSGWDSKAQKHQVQYGEKGHKHQPKLILAGPTLSAYQNLHATVQLLKADKVATPGDLATLPSQQLHVLFERSALEQTGQGTSPLPRAAFHLQANQQSAVADFEGRGFTITLAKQKPSNPYYLVFAARGWPATAAPSAATATAQTDQGHTAAVQSEQDSAAEPHADDQDADLLCLAVWGPVDLRARVITNPGARSKRPRLQSQGSADPDDILNDADAAGDGHLDELPAGLGGAAQVPVIKKVFTSDVEVQGDLSVAGTVSAARIVTPGADYAELFEKADPLEDMHPGDLVALVGNKCTLNTQHPTLMALALVSSHPAIVGNSDCHSSAQRWNRAGATHACIAMLGRACAAKVYGKVQPDDRLVAHPEGQGKALAVSKQAWTMQPSAGTVLEIQKQGQLHEEQSRVLVLVCINPTAVQDKQQSFLQQFGLFVAIMSGFANCRTKHSSVVHSVSATALADGTVPSVASAASIINCNRQQPAEHSSHSSGAVSMQNPTPVVGSRNDSVLHLTGLSSSGLHSNQTGNSALEAMCSSQAAAVQLVQSTLSVKAKIFTPFANPGHDSKSSCMLQHTHKLSCQADSVAAVAPSRAPSCLSASARPFRPSITSASLHLPDNTLCGITTTQTLPLLSAQRITVLQGNSAKPKPQHSQPLSSEHATCHYMANLSTMNNHTSTAASHAEHEAGSRSQVEASLSQLSVTAAPFLPACPAPKIAKDVAATHAAKSAQQQHDAVLMQNAVPHPAAGTLTQGTRHPHSLQVQKPEAQLSASAQPFIPSACFSLTADTRHHLGDNDACQAASAAFINKSFALMSCRPKCNATSAMNAAGNHAPTNTGAAAATTTASCCPAIIPNQQASNHSIIQSSKLSAHAPPFDPLKLGTNKQFQFNSHATCFTLTASGTLAASHPHTHHHDASHANMFSSTCSMDLPQDMHTAKGPMRGHVHLPDSRIVTSSVRHSVAITEDNYQDNNTVDENKGSAISAQQQWEHASVPAGSNHAYLASSPHQSPYQYNEQSGTSPAQGHMFRSKLSPWAVEFLPLSLWVRQALQQQQYAHQACQDDSEW